MMIIQPGRPFWAAFTAFASNMTALVAVDKLRLTEADIQIHNWWVAVVVSALVAGAVYGKEKISDLREQRAAELRQRRVDPES